MIAKEVVFSQNLFLIQSILLVYQPVFAILLDVPSALPVVPECFKKTIGNTAQKDPGN